MGIRRAAVLASATAGLLLVGCGSSTPAPERPERIDLSRLGEIAQAFPPDYPANAVSGVRELDAQRAGGVGDFYSHGKPLETDPEPCRTLLHPVLARAGEQWAAVNHSAGPEGPFISVEADDAIGVPIAIPESGCEDFTFTADRAFPGGTVEQLPAPALEAATAYALEVHFDVTNPGSAEPPIVDYLYVAILGGSTLVTVWARVPTDFADQPALPDLLTKAVAALRSD